MFGTHGVWFWVAFGCYIVGLITDLIDGRIARRSKTTSPFGRSMDSMADKTLVSSVMIALLASDRIPETAWFGSDKIFAGFVLLFVCRELLMSGIRGIKTSDQTTIAEINDRWGRIRFLILHTGMLVLLFPLSPTVVQQVGTIAVGLSIAMAYGVSIYYIKRDAYAILSSMMPRNHIPSGVARIPQKKVNLSRLSFGNCCQRGACLGAVPTAGGSSQAALYGVGVRSRKPMSR
jgi:CDP-diacylglycerol---glycerol-3-phosphate 3-phosphatidyltransferase